MINTNYTIEIIGVYMNRKHKLLIGIGFTFLFLLSLSFSIATVTAADDFEVPQDNLTLNYLFEETRDGIAVMKTSYGGWGGIQYSGATWENCAVLIKTHEYHSNFLGILCRKDDTAPSGYSCGFNEANNAFQSAGYVNSGFTGASDYNVNSVNTRGLTNPSYPYELILNAYTLSDGNVRVSTF